MQLSTTAALSKTGLSMTGLFTNLTATQLALLATICQPDRFVYHYRVVPNHR